MKQVLLALVVSILIPLGARADTSWKGTSTNMSGNFNYGPVTFKVRGSKILNFKIEGVTTSGCGGYKNVVVPTIKIRGKTFSAVYTPIPSLDGKFKATRR